MTTRVYGYSDDLIEIEGDFIEEFNCYPPNHDPVYLGFSNGIVLRIFYDPDGWKIRPVKKAERVTIKEADADHEYGSYTDMVSFEDPVEWAILGENFVGKSLPA